MKILGVLVMIILNSYVNYNKPINVKLQNRKVVNLFNRKLEMSIGENLNQINEAEIIREFPIKSQRPTYIFKDEVHEIKFSINYGSTNADDKQLPQIKAYFENVYKASSSNFISSDLSTINHKQFVVMQFELLNKSNYSKVFNYLFITTVAGKLLMADYSFPSEQGSIQEKQAQAILNSVIIKN
jgi:hypothetical protein